MIVYVLQTDNRPTLDYLLMSQEVNRRFCEHLNYKYLFIKLDKFTHGKIHPATKKIHVVNDILQNRTGDVLVFLDSDAWIQNGFLLNEMIHNLMNDDLTHGCFSRDPYLKNNTFVNSGSFIVKMNHYIKNMYRDLVAEFHANQEYHHKWPYDQYYISKYVFDNKDQFSIFVPDILNTPYGKILRHNWVKNEKMYDDMNDLLNNDVSINETSFDERKHYDDQDFPNTIRDGCEMRKILEKKYGKGFVSKYLYRHPNSTWCSD